MFRPHLVQGWSPDFIPQLAEDAQLGGFIDEVVGVGGAEAMRLSRQLATREGIFTGVSGGAALAGGLSIASRAPKGSRILVMLADTGERYLSTTLFEGVPEHMDNDEVAISKSTPGYRFDVRPAPKPSDGEDDAVEITLTPKALSYVDEVTSNRDEPVVMFALEWCEFCWSARKFFDKLGIAYRSVDLDSVAYQDGNFGGEIRHVLAAQTGQKTIPQIYVGGVHLGGCTDLFDSFKDGRLAPLLAKAEVDYDTAASFDPYTLLPGWLHPR
jgi:cysteine synthase A